MAAVFRAAYHRSLNRIELALPAKMRPFWNHECGPKTVFFYAPLVKWTLTAVFVAKVRSSGYSRNPQTCIGELVSVFSGLRDAPESFIWSRYTLVIIPRTWALFAVNFFVGCCGTVQLGRIWVYRQSLGKTGVPLAEIEDSG